MINTYSMYRLRQNTLENISIDPAVIIFIRFLGYTETFKTRRVSSEMNTLLSDMMHHHRIDIQHTSMFLPQIDGFKCTDIFPIPALILNKCVYTVRTCTIDRPRIPKFKDWINAMTPYLMKSDTSTDSTVYLFVHSKKMYYLVFMQQNDKPIVLLIYFDDPHVKQYNIFSTNIDAHSDRIAILLIIHPCDYKNELYVAGYDEYVMLGTDICNNTTQALVTKPLYKCQEGCNMVTLSLPIHSCDDGMPFISASYCAMIEEI